MAVVLTGFLLLHATSSTALSAPKPDLWARWEQHDPVGTIGVDHTPWAEFLRKYLVTGHASGINRVRYAAVTPDDRKRLSEYLKQLEGVRTGALNRSEQKAYWINLYNALTVKVILDHYPVKSIRDVDISPGLFSNGPWDAKLVRIEGEAVSLNDIEHRILRPIWKDNRVHYAVNCASLGCPNLQPQPFTAENTEQLLEKAAAEYINHPRGARVEGGTLILSSIYDWFQIDFGATEQGIIEHVKKYAGTSLGESLRAFRGKARYEYDWALNE